MPAPHHRGRAVSDVFLLLISPFVGSFLGVLVLRLPRGEGVMAGRSRCPHCQATLGVADLMPLLSYLLRGGRCRHCGARLSWLYPGIELAALGVAGWALWVLSGSGQAEAWLVWAGAALGWMLLALALIDLRHFLLPDVLTLPLIPAGLAVAWLVEPAKLLPHGIGAAAGFAAFAALAWGYRRLRGREGLGLGDAKLFAAAGAWVSWQGLGSVLLWAALPALAVTLVLGLGRGGLSGRTPLPFGAYLAAGLWLTWLYGPLLPAWTLP